MIVLFIQNFANDLNEALCLLEILKKNLKKKIFTNFYFKKKNSYVQPVLPVVFQFYFDNCLKREIERERDDNFLFVHFFVTLLFRFN